MKLIVGVADMKVSRAPGDTIITYSLGSCIGVALHDPAAKVGGLLHFMLPESSLSPEKAQANPFMFADTGIAAFFREAYRLGAAKERIVVKVAGGSQVLDPNGMFNIGKRNILAMRKIFWQHGVLMGGTALGGNVNRTVTVHVSTGEVHVKTSGQGTELL